MLNNNQITRSLCAVMLVLCLLLPGTVIPAEAAPLDPNDVYAVDVEFGNLSFYYDYGLWNANTMCYEADSSSTYPAIGTPDGYPGWYGFDGIANKITIKNTSPGGNSVTVALGYRPLQGDEQGVGVSGVSMVVDGWAARGTTYVTDVPVGEEGVTAFIHLVGEPMVSASEAYASATMQPIGMLSLIIQSPI